MDEAERRARLSEENTAGVAAFADGRLEEAARRWEAVVRGLTPGDDDWAPQVYENLGLAYHNLGWPRPALLAFLRALDGNPTGRQQSARFAVVCALNRVHLQDARRLLEHYLAHFGAHPDGWTEAAIADFERRRKSTR